MSNCYNGYMVNNNNNRAPEETPVKKSLNGRLTDLYAKPGSPKPSSPKPSSPDQDISDPDVSKKKWVSDIEKHKQLSYRQKRGMVDQQGKKIFLFAFDFGTKFIAKNTFC